MELLETNVAPDFEALRKCILREGTPDRVHYMELFQDWEIQQQVSERFNIASAFDENDPFYGLQCNVAVQRFLGYDMVRAPIGLDFPRNTQAVDDTTTVEGQQRAQRNWTDEHSGPIQTREDFEKYPWPDPAKVDYSSLEWLEENLPDNMAYYVLTAHVLEQPTWLMGYETLCIKMYDEPDLVDDVFRKCGEIWQDLTERICRFPRLGVVWGSDDMGFRGQTLLPPDALREKVFPWHKKAAATAHEHGKIYFLHACGQLEEVMDDLIDDVIIDAKHSYEDTIMGPIEAVKRYGERIAILGGIDVDFLCRSDEAAIRKRVRETLDACQAGGGYCLGSGNSVANYIPVENYLVMLDEGRRYSA